MPGTRQFARTHPPSSSRITSPRYFSSWGNGPLSSFSGLIRVTLTVLPPGLRYSELPSRIALSIENHAWTVVITCSVSGFHPHRFRLMRRHERILASQGTGNGANRGHGLELADAGVDRCAVPGADVPAL